jgi:hypothetical protein
MLMERFILDDSRRLNDASRPGKSSEFRSGFDSISRPVAVTSEAMRNSLRGLIVLTALLLLVIGCKSSGGKKDTALDTPSGAPEAVIQSAEIEPILAAARAFFTGRGYSEVPSRHAYELVFDRRLESGRKSQALRVRLRGEQLDPTSWKLHGRPMKVDGWRGDLASETLVPFGFPQVQQFLEAIKLQVELSLGSDLNI